MQIIINSLLSPNLCLLSSVFTVLQSCHPKTREARSTKCQQKKRGDIKYCRKKQPSQQTCHAHFLLLFFPELLLQNAKCRTKSHTMSEHSKTNFNPKRVLKTDYAAVCKRVNRLACISSFLRRRDSHPASSSSGLVGETRRDVD
jgi:hypothetical protein